LAVLLEGIDLRQGKRRKRFSLQEATGPGPETQEGREREVRS